MHPDIMGALQASITTMRILLSRFIARSYQVQSCVGGFGVQRGTRLAPHAEDVEAAKARIRARAIRLVMARYCTHGG